MQQQSEIGVVYGLVLVGMFAYSIYFALKNGASHIRATKGLRSDREAMLYLVRKALFYLTMPSIVLTIIIVCLGLWLGAPGLRQ